MFIPICFGGYKLCVFKHILASLKPPFFHTVPEHFAYFVPRVYAGGGGEPDIVRPHVIKNHRKLYASRLVLLIGGLSYLRFALCISVTDLVVKCALCLCKASWR